MLIENFYETIKNKYPDLTLDDVGRICSSPFHFANRAITSALLPIIRFKYLGVFSVKRNKAICAREEIITKFNMGNMKEKYYLIELEKLNRVIEQPECIIHKPDVDIEDDL